MSKLNIVILFGGASEEHEVSVKSAREITEHINAEKFQPIYIGITKEGAWRLCDRPKIGWEQESCQPAILSPDKAIHGLIVLKEKEYQLIPVDVAFSALHGKTGEDGAIQGLFELSGIPYVGCGIESSVICMDKALTYTVARNAGFLTPNFSVIDEETNIAEKNFSYPVFVKPARSGSSFGVTKVEKQAELPAAIEAARKYDTKILIEEAVIGAEVGCAVLGNRDKLVVGEVDQITLSHGIFRIHQEETPENGSENSFFTVPADIPAEKRKEIQHTAKEIFRSLGCEGLARIDLFLREDGQLVINEINTLPGFTSYSRYPRMMAAAGNSLSQLIESCIELALENRLKV